MQMTSQTETLRRRPATGIRHELRETPPTDDELSSSCSDSTANREEEADPPSTAHADDVAPSTSPMTRRVLPWTGLAIWPLMLSLPLLLNHTRTCHYSALFPRTWYAIRGEHWRDESVEEGGVWEWGTEFYGGGGDGKPLRHPLGLALGISAVAVGHFFLLVYFRLHQQQLLGTTTPVQRRGAARYVYSEALKHHLAQPGGFSLLGLYLAVTWAFDLLPPSYYSFAGGIRYSDVARCLVCQDFVQHVMHRLEHVAHPVIYRASHKPHHKFTNPKLFDAYDGSVPDTAAMILLPLFVTAHVVRTCNVWTYMAFGSTYANWLTLIHSEVAFPWEPAFRSLGLGTAADHHVHHKFFKYNFGHLFMWFDWAAGTYRNPNGMKAFNEGV